MWTELVYSNKLSSCKSIEQTKLWKKKLNITTKGRIFFQKKGKIIRQTIVVLYEYLVGWNYFGQWHDL